MANPLINSGDAVLVVYTVLRIKTTLFSNVSILLKILVICITPMQEHSFPVLWRTL